MGVFFDVINGFLHDAKEGQFDVREEDGVCRAKTILHCTHELVRDWNSLQKFWQAVGKAEIVQVGGMQIVRDAAIFFQSVGEELVAPA